MKKLFYIIAIFLSFSMLSGKAENINKKTEIMESKTSFAANIVQYKVSKKKCKIDDKIVKYITGKAGYGCAKFMGRIHLNMKEQEEVSLLDFMNKKMLVTVVGKKNDIIDIRVRIPGEVDAIFSPVIGGSFVVGYDINKKKKEGVMFLIYVV